MKLSHILLFTTFITATLTSPTLAQSKSGGDSPLLTNYVVQPDTDIDDGSELSTDTFALRLGLPISRKPGQFMALTARYQWTDFDFNGVTPGSFGSQQPWDEIQALRFSLPTFWDLSDQWTLFAMPSLRLTFEDSADISDGLTFGALIGSTYQWSDTLSIGPGLGFNSHLEDSISIFPLLYIDWQISESLRLTTRPSGGPVSGPGLTILWRISDQWQVSFAANYERLRFRLDEDNTAAPEGVGEYSGIPLYAALGFQAHENIRINTFAGVRFANEVRLEDHRGHTLAKEDTDAAPFFGVGLSLHF
jgi:hypothetical protein